MEPTRSAAAESYHVTDSAPEQQSGQKHPPQQPQHELDEDTKLRLAMRTSHATMPGASSASPSCSSSKASQDQMLDLIELRQIQKNRQDGRDVLPNDDAPPPPNTNEEQPIYDLQDRMDGFRDEENHKVETAEERKQRKTILLVLLVVCVILVAVIVGVVVGLGLENQQAVGKGDSIDEETRAFDECRSGSDIYHESDRFVEIRSVVERAALNAFLTHDVDLAGSSSRAALCWISDFDSYQIEVDGGSEYQVVQRFALASLHFHFVGSATSNLNWLSPVDTCEFQHIVCNGTLSNIVTELVVTNLPLNSNIPKEFSLLSNLVDLRLSEVGLVGEIPSELLNLSQLEVLDLSDNKLTGEIKPELTTFPQLRFIKLSNNQLNGEIPSQLYDLPQLYQLDLSRNELTGTLPAGLERASNLRGLSIELNVVTGELPDMSEVTSLEHLILANNQISGLFPDLSGCADLQTLHLGATLTGGTIPSYLWSLRKLKDISLENTSLIGSLPTEIALLTNLEKLSLSGTGLSGSIPSAYGNLSLLERLTLGLSRATGTVPTELSFLTNLETLHVPPVIDGVVPSEICALREFSLTFLQGPCQQCDCCSTCW